MFPVPKPKTVYRGRGGPPKSLRTGLPTSFEELPRRRGRPKGSMNKKSAGGTLKKLASLVPNIKFYEKSGVIVKRGRGRPRKSTVPPVPQTSTNPLPQAKSTAHNIIWDSLFS